MSARRKPSTRDEVLADLKAKRTAYGPSKLPPERVYRHAAERDPAPAPRPSNGGPQFYDSNLAELRDICTTLYPEERWIPRFARDSGEHQRVIRRWLSGDAQMPLSALADAKTLLRQQQARLARLVTRLGLDDEREI